MVQHEWTKEQGVNEGHWVQLHSGAHFHPLDPDPESIKVEDIAYGLGSTFRFGGHSDPRLTVAEHSWKMAHYALLTGANYAQASWILMHDAPEAFTSIDVQRPMKPAFLVAEEPAKLEAPFTSESSRLLRWSEYETRIMDAVSEGLGLPPMTGMLYDYIKDLDTSILMNEAEAVLEEPEWRIEMEAEPLPRIEIDGWSPDEATEKFMEMWEEIEDGRR